MSFVEVRFPEDISYSSTGGPEFSTDVVMANNGYEQRNINWSISRARYNISYRTKSSEQLSSLISFFRARKGRAIGFRFKDWSDFAVINQEIGICDGEQITFQLIKTYMSGIDKYVRIIHKPVYDTVKVYLNEQEEKEYSIDYSTGRLTFVQPPKKGSVLTVSFEFDVPVRFDTDYLNTSLDSYGSGSCNNIPLVEIKLNVSNL